MLLTVICVIFSKLSNLSCSFYTNIVLIIFSRLFYNIFIFFRFFLPYRYLITHYKSALLHNSMYIIFLYKIYITTGFKFCNIVFAKGLLFPLKGKNFCFQVPSCNLNCDGMIIFIPIFFIIIAIKYLKC